MSRKPPTKADLKRFDALYQIGDIVAKLRGEPHEPATLHHLTEGGRRLGHAFTIPLNPWRHQGLVLPEHTSETMEAFYGPSLAKDKKAFEAAYGTELELLDRVNQLLTEGR